MDLYSILYVSFFLITLGVFSICNLYWRKVTLAVSSLTFYGWFGYEILWYFVVLLGIVFFVNNADRKTVGKSMVPAIGIIITLLILILFKYLSPVTHYIGTDNAGLDNIIKLLYPIGISYTSFQAIGFIIDVKYENLKSKPSYVDLIIYLFFFPKVLSGPVEKSYKFLPQLNKLELKAEYIRTGLIMILWGCFKKLVIADSLGIAVNKLYANPESFTTADCLLITILYAIQVYVDFSGYSDMALGSCKIFGIDVTQNFRSPFLSKNITEFWRRWHISLGNWFNEYYYQEVALHLRSFRQYGIYFALLTTFFLIGLWHGMSSGFILFGLIHGLAIMYELRTKKLRTYLSKSTPSVFYNSLSVFITFSFYSFSCIFFRSTSFSQSIYLIKNSLLGVKDAILMLAQPSSIIQYVSKFATKFGFYKLDIFILIVTIGLLLTIDIAKQKKDLVEYLNTKSIYLRWSFYYTIATLLIFFGSFNSVQTFIYKQF